MGKFKGIFDPGLAPGNDFIPSVLLCLIIILISFPHSLSLSFPYALSLSLSFPYALCLSLSPLSVYLPSRYRGLIYLEALLYFISLKVLTTMSIILYYYISCVVTIKCLPVIATWIITYIISYTATTLTNSYSMPKN